MFNRDAFKKWLIKECKFLIGFIVFSLLGYAVLTLFYRVSRLTPQIPIGVMALFAAPLIRLTLSVPGFFILQRQARAKKAG